MKYIKRPIPVEAIQWTGANFNEIQAFMNGNNPVLTAKNELIISTLEGDMYAPIGSYIICGVTGSDYYPCGREIFEQSYMSLPEQKTLDVHCESCGADFQTTEHPALFYDFIEQNYVYCIFCPHCHRRIELHEY